MSLASSETDLSTDAYLVTRHRLTPDPVRMTLDPSRMLTQPRPPDCILSPIMVTLNPQGPQYIVYHKGDQSRYCGCSELLSPAGGTAKPGFSQLPLITSHCGSMPMAMIMRRKM
jgi:hypothetical protein